MCHVIVSVCSLLIDIDIYGVKLKNTIDLKKGCVYNAKNSECNLILTWYAAIMLKKTWAICNRRQFLTEINT